MTYKDLNDRLDEPDIVPIKASGSPPLSHVYFELRGGELKSSLFGQLDTEMIIGSLKIQIILDKSDVISRIKKG